MPPLLQLHEEYFDACLAHSFYSLLRVLRSQHEMLRWLNASHAEAARASAEAEAAQVAAKVHAEKEAEGSKKADAEAAALAAQAAAESAKVAAEVRRKAKEAAEAEARAAEIAKARAKKIELDAFKKNSSGGRKSVDGEGGGGGGGNAAAENGGGAEAEAEATAEADADAADTNGSAAEAAAEDKAGEDAAAAVLAAVPVAGDGSAVPTEVTPSNIGALDAAAKVAARLARTRAAKAKEAAEAAEAAAAAAATRVSRLGVLRQTVGSSRRTIWDLMQRRVAVFLGSAPLSTFTVDQFLDVVAGVTRFIKLGEAFAGSDSHGLRSALRSKSRAFYLHFHRERLEELKMRLESETWQCLPLQRGWKVSHLKELKDNWRGEARLQCHAVFDLPNATPDAASSSSASASTSAPPPPPPPPEGTTSATEGDAASPLPPDYATAAAFFAAMDATALKITSTSMAKLSEASASDADALVAATTPGTAADVGPAPVLCGTALNVMKFTGWYLRITQVMAPLATDVLRSLAGSIELYVYTVFCTFWDGPMPGQPGFAEHGGSAMVPSLAQLLLRLHHRTQAVGATDGAMAESVSAEEAEALAEVRRVSASISLERLQEPLKTAEMFALSQTVVGMESLRQLGDLLYAQGQRLKQESKGVAERDGAAAAGARDAVLASFFGDDGVVSQLPALCGLIYRGVARGMLDLEPVVSSIRNRSWAPKEIGTQHSPYVDQLLSHVQSLQSQLEAFGVPATVQVTLMGEVVQSICEQLVDGYAHIKKVSDEGRALMTIDVQTLQSGLRKLLAPGQPLPMDYVFTCVNPRPPHPPAPACMYARTHAFARLRARTCPSCESLCTPVLASAFARLRPARGACEHACVHGGVGHAPLLASRRFIKAFYLPADDILEWARAHPEYSVKHLSGLVAVTGVNTQAKKKILSQLEKGGS